MIGLLYGSVPGMVMLVQIGQVDAGGSVSGVYDLLLHGLGDRKGTELMPLSEVIITCGSQNCIWMPKLISGFFNR